MRLFLTLFSLFLGITISMPADAVNNELLSFPVQERTLANGLHVIVVPTGFPNLVSLQIPVQTGSRNEVEPGRSGFAHFFEHMMFRGTPSVSPDAYQAELTRAGARSNAYTTDDYTNYHTTFAKEDLATMLRLEADRFQHLSYTEAVFKTEAQAVLGEYNKNSAEPFNQLLEVQREHAYRVHTYKHTTMGFLRDIQDMPNQFDYSRTFFERWYRPEHCALIVAGDVVPADVFALVEQYWGGWRPGTPTAEVPAEPEPQGPIYAHVPWNAPTLPWVTVAFHGPAFSEEQKDYAAADLLLELAFGETSELHERLVTHEQKVDQLFAYASPTQDPGLMTIAARVKDPADAVLVRNEILRTLARLRSVAPAARRVQEARSNARYGLLRRLDTTDRIAALLASYVRHRRSYQTLNRYYAVYDTLTPDDLLAVARKYCTDTRLVVTTLAHGELAPEIRTLPTLASLVGPSDAMSPAIDSAPIAKPRAPRSAGPASSAAPHLRLVRAPVASQQLRVKLSFRAGSAHDPGGKEGLAALAAAMIAEAGSKDQTIDEVRQALFPLAASFDAQVDKEVTTFTGSVHRDNWDAFATTVWPLLLQPGFRDEDFRRLKDAQRSALTVDLRSNNEEELAKERLQTNLFANTPYGHPVLGTVAGIDSITLADVRDFVARAYTRANLTLGLSGTADEAFVQSLEHDLGALPAGTALPPPARVVARRPEGLEVEIVEKDTRATAISLGHPLTLTRKDADFAALSVARAWLGEHRSSMSRLFQQLRELRGLNYGDYAYIEAFPGGMFQFYPQAGVVRQAQLFEIWIRPVEPQNTQMALRLALHELQQLIERGLTAEEFESTRGYLMKNVYLLTATQDQQLGYALDSDWYGTGEFTGDMRARLGRLTRADVNAAIRKHLSAQNLAVVVVTKDAEALRKLLLADEPSSIVYSAPKPADLLAEDARVGARKLGLIPERVRVTPVDEVFRGRP
jgi:zinc protease